MEVVKGHYCTYCINLHNQLSKLYDKSCNLYEGKVSNGRNIHDYCNYKLNAQSSLKMLSDYIQTAELTCTHEGFEQCQFPNVIKYIQTSKRNVYAFIEFVGSNLYVPHGGD